MSNVYDKIAGLSPAKLELLAQQLKKRRASLSPVATIPRRQGASDIAPLSVAQQRLWFFEQLMPGSAAYNIPSVVRLKGHIDAPAFERSFNEIVRRHEVLRTTFSNAGREPVQVIAPELHIRLPVVDLRELPHIVREAEALRLATEEVRRAFDLSSGPLLRVSLLQMADDEHILLLTMHHIISDGWSTSILIRELAVLYTAYRKGEQSPLRDLAIQYADFAVWQREWLKADVLDSQLSYWRHQLADAPPLLQLPTDRPRPSVQSYRGAHQLFTLPRELHDSLKEVSRQEGVTLFMTLLAAFQVLLHYYTGERDMVVGTDVANRNRAEVEGLIGFFVNQLVLRTQVEGEKSFRELLTEVREVALSAYAHQDVPFDRVVEVLNPERDLSYAPLFQVKLVLRNAPTEGIEMPDFEWSMVELETETAQFDLVLNLETTAEGLLGVAEYSTELFEGAWVNRMLGHYEAVLRQVAAEAETSVSRVLEMLAESDRQHRLLKEKELEETGLHRLKKARRKAIKAELTATAS